MITRPSPNLMRPQLIEEIRKAYEARIDGLQFQKVNIHSRNIARCVSYISTPQRLGPSNRRSARLKGGAAARQGAEEDE